jgi:hypothetical protein
MISVEPNDGPIVGAIELMDGTRAELDADGVWHCDVDAVADDLNLSFRPEDHGPSVLDFGVVAIDLAADEFKAKGFYYRKLAIRNSTSITSASSRLR